jgi:hypothetical protein
MYTFLIRSATDGLLGKIISQKEMYTSATGFQDGPSLLKVIVTILHVTVLTPEYNCNIQKLNEYMVVLEEGPTAQGGSITGYHDERSGSLYVM